jgi:RNA polymerase sigma-70 factor (ECF subfamily)
MPLHNNMDDPRLILQRLSARDSGTFSFIFDTYSKQLFFYCRAILGVEVTAEDVVQETFVKLWEHETEFQSILSMKTFLYRTAHNMAMDILKHSRVEQRHGSRAVLELNDSVLEQKLIEEEVIAELYGVIERLPSACAKIFRMSLDGMKNGEIAELLSISIATVKTQKQRAKRVLRDHFGNLTPLLLLLISWH